MSPKHHAEVIAATVEKLAQYDSYKTLCHQQRDGEPFPSEQALREIIELTRSILFPGFFGQSVINRHTINYHIGVQTERLYTLLQNQILAGICFSCDEEGPDRMKSLGRLAQEKAEEFISYLPELRCILGTDVKATYQGDPAAETLGEVIFCYPGIRAIANYRIAHKLLVMDVPLIPRMISEMAHGETGIDIHPAATIGEYFAIDHGTGVVIGATAIIGHHVKLYQGVTLGAKSFPLDENGVPVKGIPRHPILGNHVVVYSNATILGRITIGEGASIGGNLWVTEDVPPMSKLTQQKCTRI